jgi:hypothetical protein
MAVSVTMNTPPVSSTAKELLIVSPVLRDCTLPLAGSIVPTTPLAEANQMRPPQSGRAENSLSSGVTTPFRS